MEAQRSGFPDRLTLAAFAATVVLGGFNFVAVRFTVRELPPFFGAATRFAAAGLLLVAFMAVRRVPLPRGRALAGTLAYGGLNFGAYALAYWAMIRLSAGVAGVIMASVPLLTLAFAVAHGVERFRPRALAGALLAVAGIAVLLGAPSAAGVAVPSLLAMIGAAACAAEAGVVLKQFPPSHPVGTNAVAMSTGAGLLLALSAASRETWVLPSSFATWTALIYLVLLGSVGLFGLYLFQLRRWTASGVSFQFVIFPVVASLAAAPVAGEPITAAVVLGGGIILGGVYVGALSGGGGRKVARRPSVAACVASDEAAA